MATAATAVLAALLAGNSNAKDLSKPNERLDYVIASLESDEIRYDPLVEKVKYNFFRAKDIISMEKESSANAELVVTPLEADPIDEQVDEISQVISTENEDDTSLFDPPAHSRRLLRTPTEGMVSTPQVSSRALAKSSKAMPDKTESSPSGSTTPAGPPSSRRPRPKANKNNMTKELQKHNMDLQDQVNYLHEQLGQCREDKDTASHDTVDWLFVQMSLSCDFTRENGKYYVRLYDATESTYAFSDRPHKLTDEIATWVWADTFADRFSDSKGRPNGAITFVSVDPNNPGFTYEPIISVFAEAVTWSNDDGMQLTYELVQSGDHINILPLSSMFKEGDDRTEMFETCSFFIDPWCAFGGCGSDGGDDGDDGDDGD